jgi:hypothetical protein
MSQEDMGEISIKLTVLNRLQNDLIYNVNLHRSGKVATSLNGYKETLRDLKKTREEIENILNLQKKLEESVKKLVRDHDYYNLQYEQVSVFEDENKIIQMDKYARKKPKRKD